jgi:hypothetical protein
MIMSINKKTMFRLALLLFMAVAMVQLTACGSDSAPTGSKITVETIGSPIIIGPILTNPTATATTTKTQTYRVSVTDPEGLPMNDIDVNFLGQFSNGQNINFGGAIGTATVTLSTSQKTGDFGFLDFKITSPYYSIGVPLSSPFNQTATPSATGGTLADDTYFFTVTALDYAGETIPSLPISAPVTNATTTTATGSVKLSWAAVPGATSYKVYGRSASLFPGAIGSLVIIDCSLTATPCPNPVTYTETGQDFPQGAAPPGSNTTGVGLNSIVGTAQATSGAAIATFGISF